MDISATSKIAQHPSAKVGDKAERPWGSWEVLAVGQGHVVKRIFVNAGQRLSLQYHEFRTEHWVVVSGAGEVEIDGKIFAAKPYQYFHIEQKQVHRIANIGDETLVIVETQCGDNCLESDIVRLQDDYNRHV